MAKLRKRPKDDPKSPRSAQSPADRTGAPWPPPLPVIYEQSAFEAQRLRHAPSHERHRSETLGRAVVPERATADAAPSEGTKVASPATQLLTSEPPAGPRAPRRPSPLRMSQDASADSDVAVAVAVAGSSTPGPENRRGKCGPSCQKCGRPRKPFVVDASTGESTPAPPASWPLPGPGNESLPGAWEPAHKEASVPKAPPPEPTAVPSNEERSKRRKYFSLPTKQKPSFKGPTELASGKGKAVEHPSNTAPDHERLRPLSAPAPKSAFKGPAEGGAPGPPPRATAHVRFATNEHLGRFAGVIRAPETMSSARIQALRALTPGPAAAPLRPPRMDNAVCQTSPAGPQQAPPRHPSALVAAQPAPQANSAILYEWPLATTLVNQPHSNPSTRPAALRSAPGRSSLSISKRPSRRTLRPYTNPPIPGPLPIRRTSSRHKPLLKQSRKVSYIMDQAANSSRDSMSIQILDMLQGFPGGELAATAKIERDAQLLSERPSLLRLQTCPPNVATENLTRDRGAPRDKTNAGLYSPSDYSSGDDDDDDDADDDDRPMPATPPQSEFSLTSYSIGDDKKLNRRPASTVTQTSYSIGDDRHLPLKTLSDRGLALAPPSAPSSASDDSELASAESPPSAPSTALPPAHPLTLTSNPDSEGLIPVNRRLSIVDLPEVIASGSEEDIDPDWFSWGALPGSYGSAGMWSGGPSPGLEPVGPMELGVAS